MSTLTDLILHDRLMIGQSPLLMVDVYALLFFYALWLGYSRFARKRYHSDHNLVHHVDALRLRWMEQVVNRDNRMIDATLVGNLLRSIAFFANTTIFLLIGLITAMGYRDSALELIDSIPFTMTASGLMWEIKVFNLILIFIYAFFKFTWSLRQYNYCCIIIGAAPDIDAPLEQRKHYAAKAGNLCAIAGRHFNMGLRAYYFGLAALSWFVHPLFFMAVSAMVVAVLYRREFKSHTVKSLAGILDE